MFYATYHALLTLFFTTLFIVVIAVLGYGFDWPPRIIDLASWWAVVPAFLLSVAFR